MELVLESEIAVDRVDKEYRNVRGETTLRKGTVLLVPPRELPESVCGPGCSEIQHKGQLYVAGTIQLRKALPGWVKELTGEPPHGSKGDSD